jgi:DNA polymerase IV
MEREILHVVVPSFPIALARSADPSLRGRPVAVAPTHSERALLQSVSAEAAKEGVDAGMPLFRARRLCPSLVLIPPDPRALARGTRALVELSGEYTPLVEPAHGRVFLDLTGSRSLFGPARDVALRLERGIEAGLGVGAKAGTGINKLVSRIAADLLPEEGVCDVTCGTEREFVAPFPVSVLPGIGPEREGLLLRDLNLKLVGEIAALTVPQLRLAIGAFAPLLHERSRGIDRAPVQPPRRSPEIAEESFLEEEENDDRLLLAELCRLVEGCGLRLRRLGRGAGKISLSVSYADGVTEQGTASLCVPSSLDFSLYAAAEELFLSTCRRRVRVRGLRLACGAIAEGTRQLELFSPRPEADPRRVALQGALDGLREKFGREAVRWGRVLRGEDGPAPSMLIADVDCGLAEYRYCTLTRSGK